MDSFLGSSEYVDYENDSIQKLAEELFHGLTYPEEIARKAYEFVRDRIPHSFDISSNDITAKASEVLEKRTGICHAKSNLLAALLRSQGIPTGFCYQHITLADDDSLGYCLHCYNAIYLNGKWVKVDARGNKPGVHATFSISEPQLAYPNRVEYDEYDIKGIFAIPHKETMAMLENSKTLDDIIENIPELRKDSPDSNE